MGANHKLKTWLTKSTTPYIPYENKTKKNRNEKK